MGIQRDLVAWLADMREWAKDPQAVLYKVKCTRRTVAIFPEDVTSRTDDEQLLEFIRQRCNE